MKQERPNWTRFSDRPVTLSGPARTAWEPPEQIVVMCPIIAPAGDKIWIAAQPGAKG